METLLGNNAIEALVGVLPYIVKALPPDMGLYVTDGKKYLQVAEGAELKIGISVGNLVLGKASEKCIKENRRIIFNVRDGVPFKGVNVPIVDENGYPIGTIICATGRKKQQDVNQVAVQLSDSLDHMALVMTEITRVYKGELYG